MTCRSSAGAVLCVILENSGCWNTKRKETVFISAPCGNTLLQLSIQAQNNIRHHECPSTETFQQLSFNEKHNDKPKEKQFTEKQFTTQKGQKECWGNKERKEKLQRNVTGPRKSHKMVSDECIFVRLWQHSPWGGHRRGVWRDRGPKSHILLEYSTPRPLREVVTLRICFSLAELPLILAVLTP